MVELGVTAQDLHHLQGGVSVVGEKPGPFDPAVELEGLIGALGAVEDVADEGRVEPGDQGADRVLEPGGPGTVRHHPADNNLEFFLWVLVFIRDRNGAFWGLRKRLRVGRKRLRRVKIGFGERLGGGGGAGKMIKLRS